jgi:hypothetical protein
MRAMHRLAVLSQCLATCHRSLGPGIGDGSEVKLAGRTAPRARARNDFGLTKGLFLLKILTSWVSLLAYSYFNR